MDKSTLTISPEDAVVLFADLQAGIIELSATNSLERVRKAVKELAKLAKLLQIPVFVTGVRGENGEPAKVIPEVGEILGELPTLHRTTCDAFQNAEIVSAIKGTGRKTLLVSGVATELAVQLAALGGVDQGYRVYVVLDACGGMNERTEQAALFRMNKAGATTVSVMTLAGELAGDFRDPKAQQAIGIVYEMAKV
jgi:nicotinamidase-related amidase